MNIAIGVAARISEIKPKRELAYWKPRFVYILLAASGRNDMPRFSPSVTAPKALPAYLL
jgi:hypothetical protein